MGADIHVRVLLFNDKENKWEEVKLFAKNEKGELNYISPYDKRNYELFDILDGKEDDYFPNIRLRTNSLPPELAKEVEEWQNGEYSGFNFSEANLADIKLYLKDHPKVRDYDWEDDDTFMEQGYKDNPVKDFIEYIECYIDLADMWWLGYFRKPSDIRIVYWFDN